MSTEEKKLPIRGTILEKADSKSAVHTPESLGEELVKQAAIGDAKAVSKLLLQGANVNYKEKKGNYTALIKACRMQRVDVVKILLDAKAEPNAGSKNGWTAMIEACRVGHKDLAEMLLLQKADIDCVNAMGWTPLVEAVRNGHLHIIRLLCERGTNVAIRDKDDLIPKEHTSNPTIHAVLNETWEKNMIAQGLDPVRERNRLREEQKNKMNDGDQLAEAASKNDVARLKELIEGKGVNINAQTSRGGYTALIMAARYEKPDAALYLLAKGAEINKHSTTGWTAMIEACRVGSLPLMRILYEHKGEKVDINGIQDFGWPPIIEACRNGHYPVVEQLLEWSANAGVIDKDGDAVIDHATHPWIIALLRDRVKYGNKGPQKQMKDSYVTARNLDSGSRQNLVLQCINDLERQNRNAAPEEQAAIRKAIFGVIIEELDHGIIREVLFRPGFKETVLNDFSQLLIDIVALPIPPTLEASKQKLEAIAKTLDAIMDCLFPKAAADAGAGGAAEAPNVEFSSEARSRKARFVNAMNEKRQHAALLAARKFEEQANAALKANPNINDLPYTALYFMQMTDIYVALGCRVYVIDGEGFTILHHILRPMKLGFKNAAIVDKILTFYRHIFHKYRRQISSVVINSRDKDGEVLLSYLVLATFGEDDVENRNLVLEHLEAGALIPSNEAAANTKNAQARLIGILASEMNVDSYNIVTNCWRIPRAAVRNDDVKLLKALLDKNVPIYMTDPQQIYENALLEEEKRVIEEKKTAEQKEAKVDVNIEDGEKGGKYVEPQSDTSQIDDCLLHIAIQHNNKEMFTLLCEYGSSRSKALEIPSDLPGFAVVNGPFYPWPEAGKKAGDNKETKVNFCVGWRNVYGHSSFHVIARLPTGIKDSHEVEFFQRLLQLDTAAMVTRADNYGWAPVHHAAFNNKLEIINILIENHIDLEQVTYDTGRHDKGRFPLHVASEEGNWAIVLALLKEDVNPEPIDKDGCTPLALAMVARQEAEQNSKKRLTRSSSLSKKRNSAVHKTSTADFGVGLAGAAVAQFQEQFLASFPESIDAETRGASLEVSGSGGDDDDEDEPMKAVTIKETYDMAIQALLNYGASISFASAQSGKGLQQLMNVHDRWSVFCSQMNALEDELAATRTHVFNEVRRTDDFVTRRELYTVFNRKLKVIDSRKKEIFADKETQVVVGKNYSEKIYTRLILKLIRYVIFLGLLTALGIMQSTRDQSSAYYMNQAVDNTLTSKRFPFDVSDTPKSFADMDDSTDDIINFLKGPFMATVYPATTNRPSYWSGAQLNNILGGRVAQHNYMIGIPRIRIVRSKIEDCSFINDAFNSRFKTCFSAAEDYDKASFGPNNRYNWSSAADTGSMYVWGRTDSTYDGSGYVINFPNPWDTTARSDFNDTMNMIVDDKVIDAATRAVFIEMTLFNPNENHFMTASILAELPRGGSVLPSWDYSITQLKRRVTDREKYLLILELFVLAFFVLHVWFEVLQFANSRTLSQYITSPYNLADILLILFSIVVFSMRLHELRYEDDFDWAAKDIFVKTQELNRLLYVENIIWSLLILTAWFKLFDYMSVFDSLYRLVIMISTMSARLVDFFCVFCLVVGGFTSAEYVAYGFADPSSYSWIRGFIARFFAVWTGNPIVFPHTEQYRILGTFYNLFFIIVAAMILLNLVIALLTSAYSEALKDNSADLAEQQYERLRESGFIRKQKKSTWCTCLGGNEAEDAEMVVGNAFKLIYTLKFRRDMLYAPARQKLREKRDIKEEKNRALLNLSPQQLKELLDYDAKAAAGIRQ